MNEKLLNPRMDDLFRAILALETMEECRAFFDDLCTVGELQAFSQRLQVAKLLREGRVYSDIAAETGASSATISRVNRSLAYGSDGYEVILERVKHDGE